MSTPHDVIVLDDPNKAKAIDANNLIGSILALPMQCEDAYKATANLDLTSLNHDYSHLIMSGMGGSGLGARIIESLYAPSLKVPLVRINEYHLPAWANDHSLVVCSTYSGSTEETISTAKECLSRKIPMLAICAGGELFDLAQQNQIPVYKIDPVSNPSQQPRMAVGYSVFGQLNLLSRLKLIPFEASEFDLMKSEMLNVIALNHPEVQTSKNSAKLMAISLYEKYINFVAARHLVGSAHTAKNQLNENAKCIGGIFEVPEMNHHLLEGIAEPITNPDDVTFILVHSKLYDPRIQQRMALTQEIIQKNGITVHAWEAPGTTTLSQAFATVQYFSLVIYYLSLLYGKNPAPIPWVDYFKTQLGQSLGFHPLS